MKKLYMIILLLLVGNWTSAQEVSRDYFFSVNGAMESKFAANDRLQELGIDGLHNYSMSLGLGMSAYLGKLAMSSYFEGSIFSFGSAQSSNPGYQRLTRFGFEYRYVILEKTKFLASLGLAYQHNYFMAQLNSSPTQVDFNQDPFSGNGRLVIENRQNYIGPTLHFKLAPNKPYSAQLAVYYLFGIGKRTWTSGGDLVIGLPQERMNSLNIRFCIPFAVAYHGKKGLGLKSEEKTK